MTGEAKTVRTSSDGISVRALSYYFHVLNLFANLQQCNYSRDQDFGKRTSITSIVSGVAEGRRIDERAELVQCIVWKEEKDEINRVLITFVKRLAVGGGDKGLTSHHCLGLLARVMTSSPVSFT